MPVSCRIGRRPPGCTTSICGQPMPPAIPVPSALLAAPFAAHRAARCGGPILQRTGLALERHAGELQARPPPARLHDLDLRPADAARDPGAERLARGLLRREPRREVRERVLEAAAVRELGGGEQPFLHPLAESLERLADPIDLAD